MKDSIHRRWYLRLAAISTVLNLWGAAPTALAQPCLTWQPDHLGPRSSHAMAFDAAHGRMMLYGISDLDTWARQGTTWSRIATGGPVLSVAIESVGMCYDTARQRTVMNIGSFSTGLNGTWEFDGTAWTQRAMGPQDTRVEFAMAYDQAHGRTVMYGGHEYSGGWVTDTWTWDGQAWTDIPNSGPAPRAGHAMAYDSARGVIVLFGGHDQDNISSAQTWEWNGATWTVRASTGPGGRSNAAMAFDPLRARTVLFGGDSANLVVAPETWEWDGTSWSLRASTGLAARTRSAMAFDPSRGKVVLFGGSQIISQFSVANDFEDTAEWDGSTWTDGAANVPGPRSDAALAHDAARGQTILFGGYNLSSFYGDTWAWNGAWTHLAVGGPSGRYGASMTYDSVRQRSVLFGGWTAGGASSGETWEWNGGEWSLRSSAGPSPRGSASLAYDSSRSVTVLHGGWISNVGYSPETWEWDGQNWTRRADGPGGNERARMAYDPVRQVCVLTTLVNGATTHYETWEWDGHGAGTWTARQTSGMPDLFDFALAYDPRVGAVVLAASTQGGMVSQAPGATWRWTGTSWVELAAGAHGSSNTGSLDSTRGQMVLFATGDGQVWELAPCACYANCDSSTTAPLLNVADFTCFMQKFASGNSYANCDGSAVPPVLNVADFTCYLQKYAQGCP